MIVRRGLGLDTHMKVAAALGILAAVPRFWGLFGHPTIPDEAYTYWLAAHPLREMLHLLRVFDFHPPLVYVVAHLALALTPKLFVLRALAAIAGVVGVVATYYLSLRIVGKLAWLPALLLALCPIIVYFDRFFRMYAFLCALTPLSWLLLLRALERPERAARWVGYGVMTAAMLYTHYLSFFVLAAQVLYVLATRRSEWRFYFAASLAVIAWLPWLPAFMTQFPGGGTAFNQAGSAFRDRFVFVAYMLTDGIPGFLEYNMIFLSALWALTIAGIVLAAVKRQYRLVLWLLIPAGLQVAFSVFAHKNLIGQRYLLFDVFALAVACTVVVASLLATKARVLGAAIAAALIILETTGTVDKLFVPAYMAVDWIVYANFLEQRVHADDVIVFDDIAPWFTLVNSPVVRHRKIFLIVNQSMVRSNVAAVVRYPRVWYIDYQSQFSDPDHVIFHALLRTHPKTTTWMSTEAGHQDLVVTTLFERR